MTSPQPIIVQNKPQQNQQNQPKQQSVNVEPINTNQTNQNNTDNDEQLKKTLTLLKIVAIVAASLLVIIFIGTTYDMVYSYVRDEGIPVLQKENGSDGFFETLIFNMKQFNTQKFGEFFKLLNKLEIGNWLIIWILPIITPLLMSIGLVINWLGFIYFWFSRLPHVLKYENGGVGMCVLYAILYFVALIIPFPIFTLIGIILPLCIFFYLFSLSQYSFVDMLWKNIGEQSVTYSVIMIHVVMILCFVQYGYGVGLLALLSCLIASFALIRNYIIS